MRVIVRCNPDYLSFIQHTQKKTRDLYLFIWIGVSPGFHLELPWVYHSILGEDNALWNTTVIYNNMLT